jgi:tripartite-type tricarboxylate transporter receptor subunit TctC
MINRKKMDKSNRWLVMIVVLGLLLAMCVGTSTVGAQEKFPNKPIKFIVPWSPGGLKPVLFEMMRPYLQEELGVPVVIENKPGAGGAVGWKELQEAEPDGYSIGAASNSIFVATVLTEGDVDYRNFDPILSLMVSDSAITVNSESEWETFEEFYEYAKAHPGKVRVGTSGVGAIWYIALVALNEAAGLELVSVPYGGGGEAITALMGGHIEAVSVTPDDMMATLPTGKLRILAIGAEKRNPNYPDIPTIKEAIGAEVVVGNWSGIMAPAGVPEDRIKIIADAFEKVTKRDEYIQFLEKNRLNNDYRGYEEFKEAYYKDAELMIGILETLDLKK